MPKRHVIVLLQSKPVIDARAQSLDAMVVEKLSRLVGSTRAMAIHAETLVKIGRKSLSTSDDLLAYADHVAKQEGFLGAMGGLLRVQAVLRGAKA